jgi:hypothetical protein
MKILNLIAAFLISGFVFNAFGQKSGGESVESFKIAFITKRLDLTPEQAEKFWPIYNQYTDDLKALREKNTKVLQYVYINIETMTDNELENIVSQELAFRQNELDITKKYIPQFKSVLPIRKVLKLFKAEEDFKKELIKRMSQNNR